MAHLTIYKDSDRNSTTVSNRFIDEYMPDANAAQVKVYLFLTRMLSAGKDTSVSDMADKFNYPEKDIIRALKYWETKGLLSLDCDASGIPVGIRFKDLEAPAADSLNHTSTSSCLAMSVEAPERTLTQKQSSVYKQDYYPLPENLSFDKTSYEKPTFEKPSYSAGQLRAFKDSEETAQLLFIAESYIGHPLTPAEIKSILFFTDVLNFSEDLIDHLIAYCVDRGKRDFKYIEKVAVSWAENGITTPAQARKFSTRYDKNVYAIMNALGKNSSPTAKEAEFITRWTGEYGFELDIILEACERTVLATDRHRLEYAESILSSWRQENVRHKADIQKIDALYHRKRTPAKPAPSNNKFNQFSQNNYDFEALEKELLSN